jgi:hypothetical protein
MSQMRMQTLLKKPTLDQSRENWKVSMTKILHGPSHIIIQHIDQYDSLSMYSLYYQIHTSLKKKYIILLNFVTNELKCGSRFQSSLASCFEHILQVDLGQQPPPPNRINKF